MTDRDQPTIVNPKDQAKAKRAPFAAMVVILAAMGIVKPWEGLSLKTYLDIVNVATVCYGQTGAHAAPGAVYSKAQCEEMLGEELVVFAGKLEHCVSKDAKLTPKQQAVILSWAYNVGASAACSSTLVRKINRGEPPSIWCPELLRWDRAGGKPVKGLTNRRKAEYAECIAA